MKLAEALAERSDCQKRLEVMKTRLADSARIQEGEESAEDPNDLLAEADRIYGRLLNLISAINRTNSRSEFDTARRSLTRSPSVMFRGSSECPRSLVPA